MDCRCLEFSVGVRCHLAVVSLDTLPTAEILSGKSVRAWVSMVLYLKIKIKIEILKQNKILGAI